MTLRQFVIILGFVAVIGVVYYLTIGRGSEVCTVCLTAQGRTGCATGSGGTAADAVERARRSACNELTGTDSGHAACMNTPPTSVQCRTR